MEAHDQKQHRTKRRSFLLFAVVGLLLVPALLAVESFGFGCFLRNTFGLPCPSCGMSRALSAFYAGNVREALTMHPLFILLLIDIAVLLFVLIAALIRKRRHLQPIRLFSRRSLTLFITVNYVLLFIVYLIRMLLFYPGTEPMTFNQDALLPLFYRVLFTRG